MQLNVTKSVEQFEKVIKEKDNFTSLDYDLFCGLASKDMVEVNIEEFKEMIGTEDIQIIDVRNDWEQPRIDQLNPLIMPIQEISDYVMQINKEKKVIVCCQHGIRSVAAIEYLKKEHGYSNLINLKGGLASWK